MKKKTRKNEDGRSMVEMLGVLSIIGVLSVAGIAGFKAAINKNKANELLASVMQEAVLISAQFSSGKTSPTLSSQNSLFLSVGLTTNPNNFKLVLSSVDTDVCNTIKGMLGKSSFIHETNYNCTELTLGKNLGPKEAEKCQTKSDCTSGCDDCIDGVCQEKCPTGTQCAINAYGGDFNFVKQCSSRVMSDFYCHQIVENDNGEKSCCLYPNDYCCPEGSFYSTYDNTCHSCDEEDDIRMLNANASAVCRFCPNRLSLDMYCVTSCPNPEMIIIDRYCTCPFEKPYLSYSINKCFSLDELQVNGAYRINNRYRKDESGKLIFDRSYDWEAKPLKNNPHFFISGGTLLKCPNDKIGINLSTCKTCDQIDFSSVKFQSQCEFCNGTWDGENWYTGTCLE